MAKYTQLDSNTSEKHGENGENGDSERRCVPQCAEIAGWSQIRALIEACSDLPAEAKQWLIEHVDEACREGVTG